VKSALESLLMSFERVLAYEEAAKAISSYAVQLRQRQREIERVSLNAALDRILATAMFADRDQPPFPRSTRDGFACRSSEACQRIPLKIIGQIPAGAHWEGTVSAGQAVEIMTGAPVPEGADCVVMLEHVHQEKGHVSLLASQKIAPKENIVLQGAEAKKGELLLDEGTRMRAQEFALAATNGHNELTVYSKPKIAILATGDELVEIDCQPLPHQIRNSNSYSLAAQVKAAGGEPIHLPIVADNHQALRRVMAEIPPVNMLLLSGGVSAGKYDLVEEILAERNAEFFFTGVRIQPGKPVVCGSISLQREQPIPFFGLPGNPVSTMVTFALFVQPVLEALQGAHISTPRFALATLWEPVRRKEGLTRFLPAICDPTTAEVRLIPWQGSGDMAATARANCYLVMPSDRSQLNSGETVKVLLT
jgi:molybdopterin molybdotransferase